jgi:hypothetical protein
MFVSWLGEAVAAGVVEPHAITVSTVDADGAPDERVLVLEDEDDRVGSSLPLRPVRKVGPGGSRDVRSGFAAHRPRPRDVRSWVVASMAM